MKPETKDKIPISIKTKYCPAISYFNNDASLYILHKKTYKYFEMKNFCYEAYMLKTASAGLLLTS